MPRGRPRKPELTDAEFNLATRILNAGDGRTPGHGMRSAARAINDLRAAAGRDRDSITETWLRPQLAKRGYTPPTVHPTLRHKAPRPAVLGEPADVESDLSSEGNHPEAVL